MKLFNKMKNNTQVPIQNDVIQNNIYGSVMDFTVERIIFLSLDTQRSGIKRYLGMDGTQLIVKEVMEENCIDIDKYYEMTNDRVFKILDDIALDLNVREIWLKKYKDWLYKSYKNFSTYKK